MALLCEVEVSGESLRSNYRSLALPIFLAVMAVGCNKQTRNSQPSPQQPAPVVQRAAAVQQPPQAPVASRSKMVSLGTVVTATEANAVVALRSLGTAEVTYSATHSRYAFTCQIADLVPLNPQLPDRLRELRGDYKVTITGCDGPPAMKYWITAVPSKPELSFRAFCANEDLVIRYASDGKQDSCVGSHLEGEAVKEPESEAQDQAEQRATFQRVSGEAVPLGKQNF